MRMSVCNSEPPRRRLSRSRPRRRTTTTVITTATLTRTTRVRSTPPVYRRGCFGCWSCPARGIRWATKACRRNGGQLRPQASCSSRRGISALTGLALTVATAQPGAADQCRARRGDGGPRAGRKAGAHRYPAGHAGRGRALLLPEAVAPDPATSSGSARLRAGWSTLSERWPARATGPGEEAAPPPPSCP
jgi:hypothetical protein